jgi:N6-adenosine-specific RNA methylase IME4
MNIRVDKKFKDLIPPLTDEERRQLEENIAAAGKAYDTIKVWEGKIVDGHNRYDICRKLKLPFKVEELKFESRDHAEAWVINNQFGRRNVGPFQRSELALKLKEAKAAIALQKCRDAGAGKGSTNSSNPLDTRKELAEVAGVGQEYLSRVERIQAAADEGLVDEETLADLRADRVSANKVITAINRAKAVEELESVTAKKQKALKGQYDVIVIDPPWPMQKIEREVRPNQAAFDYPTMTEEELAALKMPAAEDCHMWLWTTHKFLPMAYRLLDVWNFKYVCCFVWHKPGGFQPIGLPQYNCEFALYARRGSPKFIDTKAFNTCFDAPRGKHSEKPEEFYEVVRRVTGGRRIDVFNRRKIKGFDVWGKES